MLPVGILKFYFSALLLSTRRTPYSPRPPALPGMCFQADFTADACAIPAGHLSWAISRQRCSYRCRRLPHQFRSLRFLQWLILLHSRGHALRRCCCWCGRVRTRRQRGPLLRSASLPRVPRGHTRGSLLPYPGLLSRVPLHRGSLRPRPHDPLLPPPCPFS